MVSWVNLVYNELFESLCELFHRKRLTIHEAMDHAMAVR